MAQEGSSKSGQLDLNGGRKPRTNWRNIAEERRKTIEGLESRVKTQEELIDAHRKTIEEHQAKIKMLTSDVDDLKAAWTQERDKAEYHKEQWERQGGISTVLVDAIENLNAIIRAHRDD